ncbi:MAG TPA: carbohydrate ABC transporter permease, partial [Spirochaetota bacterium]|nr:carbohydrate ABC transporter permease [Spirochaetota bacterium]
MNVPFTAWLMTGFIGEIPDELTEAALIDGCSRWSAFLRVVVPLVGPGLAASGIFAFLTSWNEFAIASVLTRTTASKTFPVGLFDFTAEFVSDWRGMCAMSVIMLIPAIIFVIIVQRHLVRGLTLGAIKG